MINIVCALQCEANPIIRQFGLKKLPQSHPYSIFSNEEDVHLIVSGIGKLYAAAATAYLRAIRATYTPMAWINIGIAGHAEKQVGDSILAHRITDNSSGDSYYPQLIIKHNCQSAEIITVDKVKDDYEHDAIIDMEASGFFAIASTYSNLELVQSYKIISDNKLHSHKLVTKKNVEDLVQNHIHEIESIKNALCKLALSLLPEYNIEPDFKKINQHFHLTVSQKIIITQQLHHWYSLSSNILIKHLDFKKIQNGKQLITHIRTLLAKLPVVYN